MKCENCNFENINGAEFCGNCGMKINNTTTKLSTSKHNINLKNKKNC